MAEHDGGRRSGRNFGPQGNRKPFGDRNGRDGDRRGGFERKPFNRDGGERKPFGDRPQREGGERRWEDRGERKPFNRDGGDRRPYGDRKPFGDRPQREGGERRWEDRGERRPFNDRPQREDRGSFGERRSSGEGRPFNRDGGDRRPYGDRKPFGDRPQREGERRPFNRDGGERKPFGDRPQREGGERRWEDRGERKPFNRDGGDRRPYGDRKPFGDRPQREGGERRWEDRGERRPFNDRPQREDRGSFGERRSSGEGRPFNRDGGDRRPYGDRKSFGDRPQREGERRWEDRGERRPFNRDGSDRRPYGDRPQREGYGRDREDRRRDDRGPRRDDAPRYGNQDSQGRYINAADLRASNRPDRPKSPDIDEDVTGRELDRGTLGELRSLESRNGMFVAQHLVMAGRYLEEDAELAYQHALAASRRAGRLASVREAVAITAYTAGHYAEALSEFRTFRRISGSNVHLPLMADSERGLGRPDKALELVRSEDAQDLDAPGKVELAIVASGAQADKEDFAAAVAELEIPQLDINRAFSYSPRLFRAYADALVAAGREDEATRWARQALVAEEALGVGQYAEPEIFDLAGEDEEEREERRDAESTEEPAEEAPEEDDVESAEDPDDESAEGVDEDDDLHEVEADAAEEAPGTDDSQDA
ncbi:MULTISPECIES: hypothetical protein [Arthrobacter]|uniref:Tetratricopeptide repeat protein n=2 Tax=Arthrobacter TaxID=1663 RepID=A0ABU9KQP3_9MICC|nr:hypothetical protein [Arthrobacter sp. YJM1]MDP5228510.1 hypothetical protein [Arthrobacter sp. YJM1]